MRGSGNNGFIAILIFFFQGLVNRLTKIATTRTSAYIKSVWKCLYWHVSINQVLADRVFNKNFSRRQTRGVGGEWTTSNKGALSDGRRHELVGGSEGILFQEHFENWAS